MASREAAAAWERSTLTPMVLHSRGIDRFQTGVAWRAFKPGENDAEHSGEDFRAKTLHHILLADDIRL